MPRRAKVADIHDVALAMPHVTVWNERGDGRPIHQVGGRSFVFLRATVWRRANGLG